MIRKVFLLMFLFIANLSFGQNSISEGYWHAELKLNDSISLPFTMEAHQNYFEIINGDERIRVDEVTFDEDSVFIQLPVYETEIRCKKINNTLDGVYINHTRTNFSIIPFIAIHGMGWRFTDRPEKTLHNITGRWLVRWDNQEGENKVSIGVFTQEGNRVTGTFLSPTGDYRYLEGEMGGNNLLLSAFDASHAYYFDAKISPDGSLHGNYYSGSHYHDTWTAFRDSSVELVDPESMTFIKADYEKLNFSFLDEKGSLVSLSDMKYQNKVVVVQLMGTWCSNCLDETKYLVELSNTYSSKDFEIIALDFEKTTDSSRIQNNIKRIKQRLDVPYPILYAGSANKSEALKSLPMLNRIAAFPTTIIIDKKGRVRKIHTGFSGPATGSEYIKHKETFSAFIEFLMAE